MKNHHKYFVNERYKNSLEKKYIENRNRRNRIFFITRELDPRYVRDEFPWFMKRLEWNIRNDNDPLGWYLRPNKRGIYIYWDKPEVKYSIKEYFYERNYWQDTSKYQSIRKTRRILNNSEDDLYNHGRYKKLFNSWW